MEREKLLSLFVKKYLKHFQNKMDIKTFVSKITDTHNDSFWMGFIIGIVAPIIGFLLYFLGQFSHKFLLSDFWEFIVKVKLLSPLISLSLLLNLAVFFIFIWLQWDKAAKGILMGTFFYGAIIIYLKFF